MRKWYFPYGKDIEKESVNNARIETFKDDVLGSLAREICQNSLDARRDQDNPVRVSFTLKEIQTNQIPDKASFEEIIGLSRETWVMDQKAQEFLTRYESLLGQENIHVLKISDYNTSGLEGPKWDALIEKAGTSYKEDIGSAGSFGIGKAAPFASSDLRMVFYNTRLVDRSIKSIGVTKFISFDMEDGNTAQGVGYLGSHNKNPMLDETNFGFSRREEAGTDIFIIGFNQGKKWKEEIKNSILENFMIAIHQKHLVVDVDEISIDKESLGDLIDDLKLKKFNELKNYYSVLRDPRTQEIYLDDRFSKYGFKSEDAILLLSSGLDNDRSKINRSVLMTRKAGMKILDRKNISGSIQFNGIFQARGDEINNILKEMENPSHTAWIPDRYREDPSLGEDLLKDIYHFMKDNVKKHFEEKIENMVDAFGISDFLPNKPSKQSGKDHNESMEIKLKEPKLKKRKKRSSTKENVLDAKEVESIMKKTKVLEDEDGQAGPGFENTEEVEGKGGDFTAGLGEEAGKNKENSEGKELKTKSNKSFKESNNYEVKIIELDPNEGRYSVFIKGRKTSNKLKIELKVIGESGYGYAENILEARSSEGDLELDKNSFIYEGHDGVKKVSIRLATKRRVKMGVKIYENR